MGVYAKLGTVQSMLHAPKDKKNSFQGYNYRSAEDILERVKPILKEVGAVIVITDEAHPVGPDRTAYTCIDPKSPMFGKEVTSPQHIYIRATAKFVDIESGESVDVSAEAREEEVSKGTEEPKLTGKASSYARKYALNGLLAIDDGKQDPDAGSRQTNGNAPSSSSKPQGATTTPPAKQKPQGASTMDSSLRKRCKDAWAAFTSLKSVASMDAKGKETFFRAKLKSEVGKDDPTKLTAEEWDKVSQSIDFMKTEE